MDIDTPPPLETLYTALNILALQRSEPDSLSLEFADSTIVLHNPLYTCVHVIQLAQF